MTILQNKKQIKKGKLIMTITIGIMCFILSMLIFIQVRTISQSEASELEIMKESELRAEISAQKSKYEETIAKIIETNEKILTYEEAINNNKEASALLQNELKETEDLLGKNAVSGEGIIMTIASGGTYSIEAWDLLELVDILKDAGAEAIAINEQRIVYDTYIVDIATGLNSNYITIAGTTMVAPFTVKAIGNMAYLESAVSQKIYGYIDQKASQGKQVSIKRETMVKIPAYGKNLEFEYVKEGN